MVASLGGFSGCRAHFYCCTTTLTRLCKKASEAADLDPMSGRLELRFGGRKRTAGYRSHRQSVAQIVSNLASWQRRLKLF
jgi:hypothetical protein